MSIRLFVCYKLILNKIQCQHNCLPFQKEIRNYFFILSICNLFKLFQMLYMYLFNMNKLSNHVISCIVHFVLNPLTLLFCYFFLHVIDIYLGYCNLYLFLSLHKHKYRWKNLVVSFQNSIQIFKSIYPKTSTSVLFPSSIQCFYD